MATTQIMKLENIPLSIDFHDLGLADPGKRMWQEGSVKCKDGVWAWNDVAQPQGLLVMVPFAFRAVEHIEAGGIIQTDNMVELPGAPLPSAEQLAERNAQIPKSHWQVDQNGEEQEPFRFCWGSYIINPANAALATFVNSTNGQMVCIETLKGQIERMSGLRDTTRRYCRVARPYCQQKIQQAGSVFASCRLVRDR
jgi:hypothetical protein